MESLSPVVEPVTKVAGGCRTPAAESLVPPNSECEIYQILRIADPMGNTKRNVHKESII